MSSIITVCCLLLVVSIAAILNVFSYPISKKLCYKISTGIVKYCAPLIFSILSVYKNFKENFNCTPVEYITDRRLKREKTCSLKQKNPSALFVSGLEYITIHIFAIYLKEETE